MSGSVSDYQYDLPPELIANRPALRRDDSRMMVIHRKTGVIEHQTFRDFPSHLLEGDLVTLNNSRVIKARLLAEPLGIEVFLAPRSRDPRSHAPAPLLQARCRLGR